MYTTCRDMLRLNIFKKGKLVAGENGLSRIVSWPYVAKTLLMDEFFTGGEFVLIAETYVSYTEDDLLKFLELCHMHNVCGVLIFTKRLSPDKNSIPQSVIDKANEYDIPMIEMPWSVKTIDIVKQVSTLIINSQNRKNALISALRDLLFFDTVPTKSTYAQLTDLGYDDTSDYMLARFQIVDFKKYCNGKEIESESDMHSHKSFIRDNITYLLNSYLNNLIVCSNSDILIAIVQITNNSGSYEKYVLNSLSSIYDILCANFAPLDIRMCLTRKYFGITTLKDAFHETSNLFRLSNTPQYKSRAVFYDEIGINKILFEISDLDSLSRLYDSLMSPLIEFDKLNSFSLIETLKAYLFHDCNIDAAANALFIHKNSLRYRLKKIEEVMNCSLKAIKTTSELYLCFLIKDYMTQI